MDKGARDVEMAEPEVAHPLQQQFEDTEDLIATYNASSSPDKAITALQRIIGYGAFLLLPSPASRWKGSQASRNADTMCA